jgi:hypothetical protein
LASAPLVVAFVFLQRYVVRGMTVGAIKERRRPGVPVPSRPAPSAVEVVGLGSNALDLIGVIDGTPEPDTKAPLLEFEV